MDERLFFDVNQLTRESAWAHGVLRDLAGGAGYGLLALLVVVGFVRARPVGTAGGPIVSRPSSGSPSARSSPSRSASSSPTSSAAPTRRRRCAASRCSVGRRAPLAPEPHRDRRRRRRGRSAPRPGPSPRARRGACRPAALVRDGLRRRELPGRRPRRTRARRPHERARLPRRRADPRGSRSTASAGRRSLRPSGSTRATRCRRRGRRRARRRCGRRARCASSDGTRRQAPAAEHGRAARSALRAVQQSRCPGTPGPPARVAQWQSTCFVIGRREFDSPARAPPRRASGQRPGGLAQRSVR